MNKILFVCYGNICRSPMAEFLMKDYVKRKGRSKDFFISSSATSCEEIGNGVYYGTKIILDRLNIDCSKKTAIKLVKADYDKYDYIIGMEDMNVRDILRIFGGDEKGKVCKLLDFTPSPRDIADPWYTRDFEKTYADIMVGIKALYETLQKKDDKK